MTAADRWLLPDGVDELLPGQASQVEMLRRKLLDLYQRWGYELVIPPLLEYTDSLLLGLGDDVDLQTFKVIDQLTGRTMGIRADITPQTARIDAHSLKREGPTRLCYVGSVVHTKPKTLLASRSPIQLGAELYGDASLSSNTEIICLMLETLQYCGVTKVTLDLGHVGIYRALIEQADLNDEMQTLLFDALQRKATTEIEQAINKGIKDPHLAIMIRELSQLNGDRSVLDRARKLFSQAPESVLLALDELMMVADCVAARMPDINIYFDLSELRGYRYHTGLVFAALAPGHGQAVANGGRYDDIGEVFGRARPATGFNTDLKALLRYLPNSSSIEDTNTIYAPNDNGLSASESLLLWKMIQSLRAEGEQVICKLSDNDQLKQEHRRLELNKGQWEVESC